MYIAYSDLDADLDSVATMFKFHIGRIHIQIPIPTCQYKSEIGIRIRSESVSGNVSESLTCKVVVDSRFDFDYLVNLAIRTSTGAVLPLVAEQLCAVGNQIQFVSEGHPHDPSACSTEDTSIVSPPAAMWSMQVASSGAVQARLHRRAGISHTLLQHYCFIIECITLVKKCVFGSPFARQVKILMNLTVSPKSQFGQLCINTIDIITIYLIRKPEINFIVCKFNIRNGAVVVVML